MTYALDFSARINPDLPFSSADDNNGQLKARAVSRILLGIGIALAVIGVIAFIAGVILSQVGVMTFAIGLALKITTGIALGSGLVFIIASIINQLVRSVQKPQ